MVAIDDGNVGSAEMHSFTWQWIVNKRCLPEMRPLIAAS
jgi:hypothetical protein